MAYYRGEGVAQDYVEAYAWMFTAAAQGQGDALGMLKVVRGEMTLSQVRKARKLAREYQEKYISH